MYASYIDRIKSQRKSRLRSQRTIRIRKIWNGIFIIFARTFREATGREYAVVNVFGCFTIEPMLFVFRRWSESTLLVPLRASAPSRWPIYSAN